MPAGKGQAFGCCGGHSPIGDVPLVIADALENGTVPIDIKATNVNLAIFINISEYLLGQHNAAEIAPKPSTNTIQNIVHIPKKSNAALIIIRKYY